MLNIICCSIGLNVVLAQDQHSPHSLSLYPPFAPKLLHNLDPHSDLLDIRRIPRHVFKHARIHPVCSTLNILLVCGSECQQVCDNCVLLQVRVGCYSSCMPKKCASLFLSPSDMITHYVDDSCVLHYCVALFLASKFEKGMCATLDLYLLFFFFLSIATLMYNIYSDF